MTKEEGADVKLLRKIVRAFVEFPNDVSVESQHQSATAHMMVLRVNLSDYGKAFGSAGKNITALRTIFQFIAAREKRTVRLFLPEPSQRAKAVPTMYRPNPRWKSGPTLELLHEILDKILSQEYQIAELRVGNSTHFEVKATEARIFEPLRPALHSIFHAIGMNQGHELYVDAAIAVPAME